MAQARAIINIDVNTSAAAAQLRTLQNQVNSFGATLNKNNLLQAEAAQLFSNSLLDAVSATRFFTAESVKMETAARRLDQTLSKGQGTLGQYFNARFRKDSAEAAAVLSLANARAQALQTTFIETSAAAKGFRDSIAIRPLAAFNSEALVTNERLAIHRAMLTQATTSMINFGKNTQWAGRQLMVGFTVPLTIFGGAAAKTFKEIEQAAVRFKKVYGDAFTSPAEIEKNMKAVEGLALEFTKYGIAVSDTIGLAAEAAAAGAQNAELIAATTEATRLATLGQMEQGEALSATIALQNAFKLSAQDLATEVNFLNMVENQTVVTLQDLAEAIPRVAPVIVGLGGDVRDMAAMLAAMQEGGVSAAQGANALKSGLGSLINPTEKASRTLKDMGINLNAIVQANRGDLMGTVTAFAQELSKLDKFTRQQALEELFGKYQYARLGALFDNIIKDGTQASRVLQIAGMSAQDMAKSAERELSVISEATSTKFTGALERFKLAIAPIGEMFMKISTPILNFLSKLFEMFDKLPDGVKNFAAIGTVIVGVVVPAGTMFLGLLMNLVGTLIKFGSIIGSVVKGFGKGGFSGAIQAVSQSLNYMSLEEMDAANAANQLGSATQNANAALLAQITSADSATAAFTELAAAINLAARAQENYASSYPLAFQPGATAAQRAGNAPQGPRRGPQRRNKGGPIFLNDGNTVPGIGNTDTVPAMLTPGEFVVNKEATQQNLPLLYAINNGGSIPGFNKGGGIAKNGKMFYGRYAKATARKMSLDVNDLPPGPMRDRLLEALLSQGGSKGLPTQSSTAAHGFMTLPQLSAAERSALNNALKAVTPRLKGVEPVQLMSNLVGAGPSFLNAKARFGQANPQDMALLTSLVDFYLPTFSQVPAARGILSNLGISPLDAATAVASRLPGKFRSIRSSRIADQDIALEVAQAFEEAGLAPLHAALMSDRNAIRYTLPTQLTNELRRLTPGTSVHDSLLSRAFPGDVSLYRDSKGRPGYVIKSSALGLPKDLLLMPGQTYSTGTGMSYEDISMLQSQRAIESAFGGRGLTPSELKIVRMHLGMNKGGMIPGVQYLQTAGRVLSNRDILRRPLLWRYFNASDSRGAHSELLQARNLMLTGDKDTPARVSSLLGNRSEDAFIRLIAKLGGYKFDKDEEIPAWAGQIHHAHMRGPSRKTKDEKRTAGTYQKEFDADFLRYTAGYENTPLENVFSGLTKRQIKKVKELLTEKGNKKTLSLFTRLMNGTVHPTGAQEYRQLEEILNTIKEAKFRKTRSWHRQFGLLLGSTRLRLGNFDGLTQKEIETLMGIRRGDQFDVLTGTGRNKTVSQNIRRFMRGRGRNSGGIIPGVQYLFGGGPAIGGTLRRMLAARQAKILAAEPDQTLRSAAQQYADYGYSRLSPAQRVLLSQSREPFPGPQLFRGAGGSSPLIDRKLRDRLARGSYADIIDLEGEMIQFPKGSWSTDERIAYDHMKYFASENQEWIGALDALTVRGSVPLYGSTYKEHIKGEQANVIRRIKELKRQLKQAQDRISPEVVAQEEAKLEQLRIAVEQERKNIMSKFGFAEDQSLSLMERAFIRGEVDKSKAQSEYKSAQQSHKFNLEHPSKIQQQIDEQILSLYYKRDKRKRAFAELERLRQEGANVQVFFKATKSDRYIPPGEARISYIQDLTKDDPNDPLTTKLYVIGLDMGYPEMIDISHGPGARYGGRTNEYEYIRQNKGGLIPVQHLNTGGIADPIKAFATGNVFESGGRTIVPGVGNTDTVPAALTPGEFVVNKQATADNLPLLNAINSGEISGFNKGGQIPGVQYFAWNPVAGILNKKRVVQPQKQMTQMSLFGPDTPLHASPKSDPELIFSKVLRYQKPLLEQSKTELDDWGIPALVPVKDKRVVEYLISTVTGGRGLVTLIEKPASVFTVRNPKTGQMEYTFDQTGQGQMFSVRDAIKQIDLLSTTEPGLVTRFVKLLVQKNGGNPLQMDTHLLSPQGFKWREKARKEGLVNVSDDAPKAPTIDPVPETSDWWSGIARQNEVFGITPTYFRNKGGQIPGGPVINNRSLYGIPNIALMNQMGKGVAKYSLARSRGVNRRTSFMSALMEAQSRYGVIHRDTSSNLALEFLRNVGLMPAGALKKEVWSQAGRAFQASTKFQDLIEPQVRTFRSKNKETGMRKEVPLPGSPEWQGVTHFDPTDRQTISTYRPMRVHTYGDEKGQRRAGANRPDQAYSVPSGGDAQYLAYLRGERGIVMDRSHIYNRPTTLPHEISHQSRSIRGREVSLGQEEARAMMTEALVNRGQLNPGGYGAAAILKALNGDLSQVPEATRKELMARTDDYHYMFESKFQKEYLDEAKRLDALYANPGKTLLPDELVSTVTQLEQKLSKLESMRLLFPMRNPDDKALLESILGPNLSQGYYSPAKIIIKMALDPSTNKDIARVEKILFDYDKTRTRTDTLLNSGGKVPLPRLNMGDIVPGVGNTDTVPAMLTPGEFVVNKQATQDNLPLLHAINGGSIPGFMNGGMIPGVQYLVSGGEVVEMSAAEASRRGVQASNEAWGKTPHNFSKVYVITNPQTGVQEYHHTPQEARAKLDEYRRNMTGRQRRQESARAAGRVAGRVATTGGRFALNVARNAYERRAARRSAANANANSEDDGKNKPKRPGGRMMGAGMGLGAIGGAMMMAPMIPSVGQNEDLTTKLVTGGGIISSLSMLAMLPAPLAAFGAALGVASVALYKVRENIDELARTSAKAGSQLGGTANRMEKISQATGYQFASQRNPDRLFRFTKQEVKQASQFAEYFQSEAGQSFIKDLEKLSFADRYKEVSSIIAQAVADGMDEKTAKAYGDAIAYYTNDALLKSRIYSDFRNNKFKSGTQALVDLVVQRQEEFNKVAKVSTVNGVSTLGGLQDVGTSSATQGLAQLTGIGNRDIGTQIAGEGFAKVGAMAGAGALAGFAVGSIVPIVGNAVGAAIGATIGTVAGGFIAYKQAQDQLEKLNANVKIAATTFGAATQIMKEVRNAEAALIEARRKGKISISDYQDQISQLREVENKTSDSMKAIINSYLSGTQVDEGALKQAMKDQFVLQGFDAALAEAVTNSISFDEIARQVFPNFDPEQVAADPKMKEVVSSIMVQTLSGITPENAAQRLADVRSQWQIISQDLYNAMQDGATLSPEQLRDKLAGANAKQQYAAARAGATKESAPMTQNEIEAAKVRAAKEKPTTIPNTRPGGAPTQVYTDPVTGRQFTVKPQGQSIIDLLSQAQAKGKLQGENINALRENVFAQGTGDTEFNLSDAEALGRISSQLNIDKFTLIRQGLSDPEFGKKFAEGLRNASQETRDSLGLTQVEIEAMITSVEELNGLDFDLISSALENSSEVFGKWVESFDFEAIGMSAAEVTSAISQMSVSSIKDLGKVGVEGDKLRENFALLVRDLPKGIDLGVVSRNISTHLTDPAGTIANLKKEIKEINNIDFKKFGKNAKEIKQAIKDIGAEGFINHLLDAGFQLGEISDVVEKAAGQLDILRDKFKKNFTKGGKIQVTTDIITTLNGTSVDAANISDELNRIFPKGLDPILLPILLQIPNIAGGLQYLGKGGTLNLPEGAMNALDAAMASGGQSAVEGLVGSEFGTPYGSAQISAGMVAAYLGNSMMNSFSSMFGGASGAGGGGGGAKPILQQLNDSIKELDKIFKRMQQIINGKIGTFKNFMAGPFAPQFIEFLKSQGEEGIKILTGNADKFLQVYKKYVEQQQKISRNQLQALPFSFQEQARATQGRSRMEQRLSAAGIFGADARNAVLENISAPDQFFGTLNNEEFQAFLKKEKASKSQRKIYTDMRKGAIQNVKAATSGRMGAQSRTLLSEQVQAESTNLDNRLKYAMDPNIPSEFTDKLLEAGITVEDLRGKYKNLGAELYALARQQMGVNIAENLKKMNEDVTVTNNILQAVPGATQEFADELRSLGINALSSAQDIQAAAAALVQYKQRLEQTKGPLQNFAEALDIMGSGVSFEIEKINKLDIEPIQKQIDKLNESIDALEKSKRPHQDAIDKLREQEQALQKVYDERIKALEEVERVNARIAAQQQGQMNVASALSRGDIAGAAQAALDLQKTMADQRTEDLRVGIDTQYDAERSAITEKIKFNEDAIKNIDNQILTIQDNIALKQKDIEAAKQKQVELEEKLYRIQLLREAVQTRMAMQEAMTRAPDEAALYQPILASQVATLGQLGGLENIPGAAGILALLQQPLAIPQGAGIATAGQQPGQPGNFLGGIGIPGVTGQAPPGTPAAMFNQTVQQQLPVIQQTLTDLTSEETGLPGIFSKIKGQFVSFITSLSDAVVALQNFVQIAITELNAVKVSAINAINGAKVQAVAAVMAAGAAAAAMAASSGGKGSGKKSIGGFISRAFGGGINYRGSRERAPGMAMGSFVPGIGNSDKVPVLLTPGEFVVRKSVAQQFKDELQALNSQVYPNDISPLNAIAEQSGVMAPLKRAFGGIIRGMNPVTQLKDKMIRGPKPPPLPPVNPVNPIQPPPMMKPPFIRPQPVIPLPNPTPPPGMVRPLPVPSNPPIQIGPKPPRPIIRPLPKPTPAPGMPIVRPLPVTPPITKVPRPNVPTPVIRQPRLPEPRMPKMPTIIDDIRGPRMRHQGPGSGLAPITSNPLQSAIPELPRMKKVPMPRFVDPSKFNMNAFPSNVGAGFNTGINNQQESGVPSTNTTINSPVYNITVNTQTLSNANDIAQAITKRLDQRENRKIRGARISG